MLTANLDPQLQLERVLAANEAAYDKWRRQPPIHRATDTLVFADPKPLTADEQAHLREVVAGAAAGVDADSDTLEMVLDMLGILPQRPPTNVADITPKRRYGQCPVCKRTSIALRKKDGLLVGHSRVYGIPVAEARCDGGGNLPIATRKATAA